MTNKDEATLAGIRARLDISDALTYGAALIDDRVAVEGLVYTALLVERAATLRELARNIPSILAHLTQLQSDLTLQSARLAEIQGERDELKTALHYTVNERDEALNEARMGHVRLDECSDAGETKGKPLYDRISAKIQKLAEEVSERGHTIAAMGAEQDELRARAESAKHRQAAAEYRAQRIVLDALALRKAEARIAELLRELDSVENDARLWHKSEGERRRLQKGQDTSWFMFLDSLEGERLVLAERAEAAEVRLRQVEERATNIERGKD